MTKMITCVIDSVRVSLTNQQRVVVLRQTDAERYLPIWIGLYEAEAITLALQKIEVARPQTHDLLLATIKSLDSQLLYVEITALREDVFYANLVIEKDGLRKHIDCRPSDALALAARINVSILVEEEVLNSAGIQPDVDIRQTPAEMEATGIEETEEDLTLFEDFLGQLGKNVDDEENSSDEDENPNVPAI